MLSQVNKKEENGKFSHYNFFSKNRKTRGPARMTLTLLPRNRSGLSEVISYILLIAISIVMSVMVYQWLRTYVPTESVACPEGTSIFMKNISYDCSAKTLTATIQNNGKFGIDGYFIHVSNSSNSEALATIDISSKITKGGTIFGNSIKFSNSVENSLSPEESHNIIISSFNVQSYGTLYRIEIIPFRMQEIDNKKRVVSCSNAKVQESLVCN
jgi:hypothetical protein